MRRFRFVGDPKIESYKDLVFWRVYEGSFVAENWCADAQHMFNNFPEDWQEVTEPETIQVPILTKLEYFSGLAMQGLMSKDYIKLQIDKNGSKYTNLEMVADMSVKIAKELIKQLYKE